MAVEWHALLLHLVNAFPAGFQHSSTSSEVPIGFTQGKPSLFITDSICVHANLRLLPTSWML